jgi:hypothetical protein
VLPAPQKSIDFRADGKNVYFTAPGNTIKYCLRTAGCSGGFLSLATNEADVLNLITDDRQRHLG